MSGHSPVPEAEVKVDIAESAKELRALLRACDFFLDEFSCGACELKADEALVFAVPDAVDKAMSSLRSKINDLRSVVKDLDTENKEWYNVMKEVNGENRALKIQLEALQNCIVKQSREDVTDDALRKLYGKL